MAFFNDITAPLIEKNNAEALNKSLYEIIPADKYEQIDNGDSVIYVAYNAEKKVGVLVTYTEQGYGGEIKVLTGIDNEGKIVGVEILENSETAGLGANATKPEFKGQFTGKNNTVSVTKTVPGDAEIKAITGATITSKAVILSTLKTDNYIFI